MSECSRRDIVQHEQLRSSSFYGFPAHYYEEKYPNIGSPEIAQAVVTAIQDAGIKVKGVERGLDHGVWSSFKCGS
jgi:aromatic ring-opening dioxygenase catalytic subunit (LigB family)